MSMDELRRTMIDLPRKLIATARLLATGVCDAFNEDGQPAEIRMPWRQRLPLALWWWNLPTWFPEATETQR